MREYKLDIDINASAQKVWDALLDFDNYAKWNPVVPSITGVFEVGESIEHTLVKVNGEKVLYTPKVLQVEAPFKSTLAKSLLHPRFAYLVHHFELQALTDNLTRFRQRWECSGLAIPLPWNSFITRFKHFEKASAGLKAYLEHPSRQAAP